VRLVSLAAGLAMTLIAGEAAAHSVLERAQPRGGSTLSAAPAELRLQFSERIEPGFTTVQVRGADGEDVAAGAPRIASQAGKVVVQVPLAPLPPGRYTVTWRVVSADTHATDGSYQFEIRPR